MAELTFFLRLLVPGDVLLYKRSGLFAWLIRHMSNADFTHCEMYVGEGKTIGAREKGGVATFDLDIRGLVTVLRPMETFDLASCLKWQAVVTGHKYDWTGLYRSFVQNRWGKTNNAMWCSEHTTEAQRQGGVHPFPEHVPADSIAPGDFYQSVAYTKFWEEK